MYYNSNQPYQQSSNSIANEFISGAMTGLLATGVTHAGSYGLSKLKSNRPIPSSIQRFSAGMYQGGYGNWKRALGTYATAAILDGTIHGVMGGFEK